MNEEHEHSGPDCPECRAFNEQAKVMGSFAECLERMIADGTIARIGHEIARERERRLIEAILS